MKTPEEILKKNPGSAVFARYADELMQKGKTGDALKILEKGLEENPFYGPGYALLAELHARKGNVGEAVSNLETALRFQRSPHDMLRYAELTYKTDPSKAIALLETAELYEPDNIEVKSLIKNIPSSLPEIKSEETPAETSENDEFTSKFASLFEDKKVSGEYSDTGETASEIALADKKEINTSGHGIFPQSMEDKEHEAELSLNAVMEDIPEESTVINGEIALVETGIDSSTEENEASASAEEIPETFITEEAPSEADSAEIREEFASVESVHGEIVQADERDAQEEPQPGETLDNILKDSEKEEPSENADDSYFSSIEPDLPGYSEILGETENRSVEEPEQTGVIELNEDESFDISKLDFDISNDEPILTEEEKAELLSFDDDTKPADYENEMLLEEPGFSSVGAIVNAEDEDAAVKSEQSIMESFYGLSDDELLELNEIKTDIDIYDKGLETETVEGIDYSDILYGEEKNFGTEDIDDKILTEIFREAEIGEKTGENPESDEITPLKAEDDFDSLKNMVSPGDTLETDDDIAVKLADELGFDSQERIENEIPEDTKPFEEELLGDIIDDLIQDQTMPAEFTEEIYEPTLTPELHDETQAEEILNAQSESLDKLLNDYIGILKESPVSDRIESEEETPVFQMTAPEFEVQHFPKKPEQFDEYHSSESSSEEDYPDFGEATATMAEIFVSQGLVTRALDIYKTLHQKDPSNEKIRLRFENLRKSTEEQT